MSLPSQRRRQILEEIRRAGAGSVNYLSGKFGVSAATIRRDLRILEEQGRLERTHGGAVSEEILVSSPPPVLAREKRRNLRAAQKEQMAHYVARELIQNGDNIALGGGTTVAALVPLLAGKSDLTVVTNGLATTAELYLALRHHNDANILCCGGILRLVSSTFVGPVAEEFFRGLHVNKLFLSATGLTEETGVTDPSVLETQVKRAMIAAADQVIIVMDSSKFGVRSLVTVLPIAGIDILVTDDEIPARFNEMLAAHGVDVRVAPPLREPAGHPQAARS
jgi:DeoR/GlpR family transcriptional regulator of sugar metabolism